MSFFLLFLPLSQISGTITNTGHSVIFTTDNETVSSYGGMQVPVNLTGGPLSYRYRFHEIHIHYGLHDQFGSEHSVEGYAFPAEVIPLKKLFLTERASSCLRVIISFCRRHFHLCN